MCSGMGLFLLSSSLFSFWLHSLVSLVFSLCLLLLVFFLPLNMCVFMFFLWLFFFRPSSYALLPFVSLFFGFLFDYVKLCCRIPVEAGNEFISIYRMKPLRRSTEMSSWSHPWKPAGVRKSSLLGLDRLWGCHRFPPVAMKFCTTETTGLVWPSVLLSGPARSWLVHDGLWLIRLFMAMCTWCS